MAHSDATEPSALDSETASELELNSDLRFVESPTTQITSDEEEIHCPPAQSAPCVTPPSYVPAALREPPSSMEEAPKPEDDARRESPHSVGSHGERRGWRSLARRLPQPKTAASIFVVTLASGLLFGLSASNVYGRQTTDDLDLVALVRHQQQAVLDMEAENQELRGDREDVLAQAASTGAASSQASPQLATVAVSGPGVTVTLTDAPPGPIPETATPDDLVVHQQDIEDVMNALWSGGAEAMTVQGARVSSRSVIRCIGNVILVDGISYSPPYVISAIGNPEQLRDTVNANPRVVNYKAYVARYGLGWKLDTSDSLAFEPVKQDLSMRYAEVVSTDG